MSVDIRSSDRRRYMNELQAREKEIAAGLLKATQPSSPKALQESEKRIRREIANSNERRRMQCINAGFSNLRALIPQLEGEKLSKAAILQHATEYITSLEKDKSRLQIQLEHTKGLLSELSPDRVVTDTYVSSSPHPTKRKKRDTAESSDEGVCSLSDASDDGGSELQQENVALRHQVEVERQRYTTLEERNRILEAELLAFLHMQASHTGSRSEMNPANSDHHLSKHQVSFYNREVAEVNSTHETVAQSTRFDCFQPPRPMSPTPERGISREVSSIDAPIQQHVEMDSSRYSDGEPMDIAASTDSLPYVVSSISSAAPTTTAVIAAPTERHGYQHHNYCHRDHPRRRHRQQAQLEQQREEEELRRHQQQMTQASNFLHRPKENTQNLEKLVEAIRQIEGDRVLCTFDGDEQKLFDKNQGAPLEESERDTSSISDQDEPKSESSGRDSPLHHHLHRHNLQNQNLINEKLANGSVGFSENFPISSHILHRPIHPSCFRPGVIVHKH